MRFTPFSVLLIYVLAEMLAFTFFMPYVYSLGVSDLSVLLYFLIAYAVSVILIFLGKKIDAKRSIQLALVIRILTVLAIALLITKNNVPFTGILAGTIFFLFWIPINFSFFLAAGEKHATESWKYAFTTPIIGVFVPSLGGLIASWLNYKSVFLASIPLFLIAIYLTTKTEWKSVDYSLKDSLKKFSGLRTLTFIEGFWQPAFFVGIPLITANYLTSSIKFGSFYSYLGITSAIATFLMARYSDQNKKRKIFIYSVSFAMALISFAIALHGSFLQWAILAGLTYFLYPMANTFFLAMLLDIKKQDILPECMIAREYILNLSRAFGIIILILFALYGKLLHSFIMLGGAMLAYPFFLKVKRIYAIEAKNVQD